MIDFNASLSGVQVVKFIATTKAGRQAARSRAALDVDGWLPATCSPVHTFFQSFSLQRHDYLIKEPLSNYSLDSSWREIKE